MPKLKVGDGSTDPKNWSGPVPDLRQPLPGRCGTIPPETVKLWTDYIKAQHKSDTPLSDWSRFDSATAFPLYVKAELSRVALIDVLHQRQFQKRLIAAGITDKTFNSIHPEYFTEWYSWMFKNTEQAPEENTLRQADVHAPYPYTPILVTDYGEQHSHETATRTLVKHPDDSQLGFPSLLPLGGMNQYSWIASIDRIPAELFSRRIARRAYEYQQKSVIVQGLPALYEQRAAELAVNEADIAAGRPLTYPNPVSEGMEVIAEQHQDTPLSREVVQSISERRKAFAEFLKKEDFLKYPMKAKYPVLWWSIEFLSGLSKQEIAYFRKNGKLPEKLEQPYESDITEFSNCYFRIGEEDNGRALRVPLKLYLQYILSHKDDSALYLFESNLYKSTLSSKIPLLYRPPTYYAQDLVRDTMFVSERVPYSWLLCGSGQNGTSQHLDPRETMAFNTTAMGGGVKLWVLFNNQKIPSLIAKGIITFTEAELKYRDQYGTPCVSYWYMNIFPRLRRFIFHRELKRRAVLLQLKNAGVTEFVPNGHCICKCDKGRLEDLEDRIERLSKDYAVMKQDGVTFMCTCDCLCGCKLKAMTECGINLNDIDLKMEPNTTADDLFGANVWCISDEIKEFETKLLSNPHLNESILSIQQQIDLKIANYIVDIKPANCPSQHWDELRDGYALQFFAQFPGETIILSKGWHSVLNISPTIAVTENCANTANVDQVYRNMRLHNKGATRKWMYRMKQAAESLSDPEIISRWEKKTTNDGRNIDPLMSDEQRAEFWSQWLQLLHKIDQKDGYALTPFKSRPEGRDILTNITSSDSAEEKSKSETSTDPCDWSLTDSDDM